MVAESSADGTELTWNAASGVLTRLMRKKFQGDGSLYNYPLSENDGIQLAEGTGVRKFTDTTATAGKHWYYGVFAYNANTGWSLVSKGSHDNW